MGKTLKSKLETWSIVIAESAEVKKPKSRETWFHLPVTCIFLPSNYLTDILILDLIMDKLSCCIDT